ncbi:hypothetical protein PIB30_073327 [Stylosanthes scabra]|uniref:Protein kinase domain-containing protein n=1 Tax=Stylosanthes scabra TaxID=79078 RepID=A0ABU6TRM0_9FABA|nr:hypothetical protein [Stylosanthes scabra]
MGCICFKPKSAGDYVAENHIKRAKSKALNKRHTGTASLGLLEFGNDASTRSSTTMAKPQDQVAVKSTLFGVTNGERGAQVIAGWPSWLTAVAGEAISGWIGQGTYSSVYRARDLETNKIVALKKVRFATIDPESVRFMAREIILLRRLDHPNVMKLRHDHVKGFW